MRESDPKNKKALSRYGGGARGFFGGALVLFLGAFLVAPQPPDQLRTVQGSVMSVEKEPRGSYALVLVKNKAEEIEEILVNSDRLENGFSIYDLTNKTEISVRVSCVLNCRFSRPLTKSLTHGDDVIISLKRQYRNDWARVIAVSAFAALFLLVSGLLFWRQKE